MLKIKYRKVYNRKNKLNRQGEALVQVEAYLDKRKIYFSTHIYVAPECWNREKSQIVNHPHRDELNGMIHEFILKLQWKELECWKKGIPVSLDVLRSEACNRPAGACDSFVSLGKQWVETSARRESTKQNLYTTLDLLDRFCRGLSLTKLTYAMLQDFECWLRMRRYQQNTIAKHLTHLRTLVKEAVRRGYLPAKNNPFYSYKIRTTAGKHVFLLPDELEKLESLVLPARKNVLQHVLDAFLFCCYTGLRYSDFTQLTAAHLIYIEGSLWLHFRTVKTNEEIRLPLYLLFQGKAVRLIRKYEAVADDFFCLKSNSSVNRDLEKLRRLAKLEKHFSFHSARHTNATLLIHYGVKITTVQKLLGHRSIKTTQLYGDVLRDTVVEDLKKCSYTSAVANRE